MSEQEIYNEMMSKPYLKDFWVKALRGGYTAEEVKAALVSVGIVQK